MERLTTKAIVAALVGLFMAACTTVSKNSSECERMMKTAWPPGVEVTDTQASADGRTVVVSGVIEDQFWHNLVSAKVQCQFNGDQVQDFRWLAPARLAEGSVKARANSQQNR